MHSHSHSHSPDSKKGNKNLRKLLINLLLSIIILIATPFFINLLTEHSLDSIRQDYQDEFQSELNQTELAKVKNVSETSVEVENGQDYIDQILEVELEESGQIIEVERVIYPDLPTTKVSNGDRVFLIVFEDQGDINYSFVDVYRLDKVIWIIAIFVLLVVLLTGIKGFNAFVGLVFATLVIFQYMLPEVLVGSHILWTTFVTATLITGFSMYLSHGFNRYTSIAVISTFGVVLLVGLVSTIVVNFMDFSGVMTHELSHLAAFETLNRQPIDLSGLFLASIVLGTLGVLDDITISQAVIVQELKNASPKASNAKIFKRAFFVGREHIISLINTLSLAYIATALPFVIQFVVFGFEDFLVIINNEAISGEIVRTVVGSGTLLVSIPLTTLLAVNYLKPQPEEDHDHHKHLHAH